MTLPYEHDPMPPVLSVQCPDCSHEAAFEFAEWVNIRLRKDLDYFQKSKLFEFKKMSDHDGQGVNRAYYYHNLTHHSLPDISDLPDGYTVEDWQHSHHMYRPYNFDTGRIDAGSVVCAGCGLRRKHSLSWPSEAYFQVEYKRHILWAFDRVSAVELLDFIQSKDRDRSKYKYRHFLLKIPPQFLNKKVRNVVTKRLSATLLPNS